jgi:hypothetical protein
MIERLPGNATATLSTHGFATNWQLMQRLNSCRLPRGVPLTNCSG